jgi:membrane protein
MRHIKDFGRTSWHALKEFSADSCGGMAASLSYYTLFSLPAFLALLALVMGTVMDAQDFQDLLSSQVTSLIGEKGAHQIVAVLQQASNSTSKGLAAVLGILTLIFSATGAFVQLQQALNTAWEVAPDPKKGGILRFIRKRLVSLAMIASIGFLLLVSLGASAMIAAAGGALGRFTPEWLSGGLLFAIELVVSLAMISFMFSAVFKYVPDGVVRWRHAIVGGLFTGALFTVGKFAIGFYLGRRDPGSAFGAAGALALVLLWIYYSAMILLLGAEFTQVWAREHGQEVEPEEGALHVQKTLETVDTEGRHETVPQKDGLKKLPGKKGEGKKVSMKPRLRRRRTGHGARGKGHRLPEEEPGFFEIPGER